MSEFDNKYGKYLNTLAAPGLTVGAQLVRTAGKGRGQNYRKPYPIVVNRTIALFNALDAFDKTPSDATFDAVKQALAVLEMKAVRVEGSPEWIYITPDADPVKERSKWERISINTQFNLSYHVGSNSRVCASDEHNGGDGAFRVVDEMVRQGTNIKLVMSNSRHRGTSPRVNGRYVGDWAHSSATIDYPVMRYLAARDFSVINVHGWASRMYGLLVNNRTSNFTTSRSSLPTMIGIALAQFFQDVNNKKFVFGGVIPGTIVVNGKRIFLSPPNNAKVHPNALYYRATGVHNTNKIGNLVHNVNANMDHQKPFKYDSGNSCHIENGIVRDGRPDLRKMMAAINLAAYWMNNYRDDLNPWKIIKNNPNFDMLKYGDLYPANPALAAEKQRAMADNAPVAATALTKPVEEIEGIEAAAAVDFDPNDDLATLDPENEETCPQTGGMAPMRPLLLSGGPKQKATAPAAQTTEIAHKPRSFTISR